jgi:chaperonin GroES
MADQKEYIKDGALKSPEDPTTENLVKLLPGDEQKTIANQIALDYDNDVLARSDWEKKRDLFYKLWLCHREPKTTPWPDASNVCLPILATACNQFHARSYQAFFSPPSFVKAIPVGANDKKRSRNVEDFMNWQLLFDMEERYEEETDKLLLNVPIGGSNFKKCYWDSENDRPCADYISGTEVLVPYRTRDLETARRITHRFWRHIDEIKDRGESGIYANTDNVSASVSEMAKGQMPGQQTQDKIESRSNRTEDNLNLILECHKDLKTSKDKKCEPYIFTIDYSSKTLLRATRRKIKIEKGKEVTLNYFIHYGFIPNPEGFYTFGLGHFLMTLNEMANTAFNQIFDAGRVSNQPFGFYGRRAGLKRQEIKLWPGKMIEVDDASQVYFPNMQRLDSSLFQVLGFIQQYTERFTSTSDYIAGRESKGTKTPTASGTMAIIEQGLLTFNIMTKRLFRSLKKELRTIFIMNQLFLPQEKQYIVQEGFDDIAFPKITRDDFNGVQHVIPMGDPSYASKIQRRQEAQEMMAAMMGNPLVGMSNPKLQLANPRFMWELTKDFLESYDKKYLRGFLPKLPDPMIDPEAENASFMAGEYVKPKQGEDHVGHLHVHENFKKSEFYSGLTREKKDLLDQHQEETRALMYLEMKFKEMHGGQPMPGVADPNQPPAQPQPSAPQGQPPAGDPSQGGAPDESAAPDPMSSISDEAGA